MAAITESKLLKKMKEMGVDVEGTLSRFVNNDEIYIKFIIRFPNEDRMRLIWNAFETGNMEEKIQTTHKLKGVSSNLGMTNISEQCKTILDYLNQNADIDYKKLLEQLDKDYYIMCNEILNTNCDLS